MANSLLVFLAAGFLCGIAIGALTKMLPAWIGVVYWSASAVTAAMYLLDKYRARRLRRRVAERTLHLMELLGGWPGALLAQRIFRHKNRKTAYQRLFWLIVLLHLLAWVWAIAVH